MTINQIRTRMGTLLTPPAVLKPLEKRFWIGVGIVAASFVFLAVTAVYLKLWNFSKEPCFTTYDLSKRQLDSRDERRSKLQDEIWIAERRLNAFRLSLTNQAWPGFVEARAAIEKEEALLEQKKRRLEGLTIQPVSEGYFGMCFVVAVILLMCLASARAFEFHLRKVDPGLTTLFETKGIWCCFWWIVAVLFIPSLGKVLYTALMIKKTWYGASSLCISPTLWLAWPAAEFGFSMCAAYPFTLFWVGSGVPLAARELDPEHSDGKWGAGKRVLLMQAWSFLIVFLCAVPSAISIKIIQLSGRGSWEHFISIATVISLCLVVSGRFIWRAIVIRLKYHAYLAGLNQNWSEIQKLKLPPDPTIPFLGESWWRLPMVFFGSGAVVWTVLEFFQLGDYLKNFVR